VRRIKGVEKFKMGLINFEIVKEYIKLFSLISVLILFGFANGYVYAKIDEGYNFNFGFNREDANYEERKEGQYNVAIIDKEAADYMRNIYYTEYNEYGFCVYGEVGDSYIKITEVKPRKMKNRTRSSMTVYKCPDDALFGMHTHPGGNCRLSYTDVHTAGHMKHTFDGVVCRDGQVAIYHMQDWKVPLEIIEV
jgi:proteasome lid subunit RPN8/RPN11